MSDPTAAEAKTELDRLDALVEKTRGEYVKATGEVRRAWETSRDVAASLAEHYKPLRGQGDADKDAARKLTVDVLRRIEKDGLLLKPLDAQLVREAIACEVDVFLTNDKQLRSAVRRLRLPIHALSPVELMEKFARENVGLIGEDHLGHESCDAALSLLCDDIGKWGPLFEILEGESHG